MARLKNRTTARYFEKGKYVKDGLNCWTKSGADFECKVECPYNERKAECDCHTAVCKDALEYINELEAKNADVVPKSEVAREICCEIEEEIVAALESNYRALKEWDDGRCNDYILEMVGRINGKIDALRGIEGFVEELKKKYTEGKE